MKFKAITHEGHAHIICDELSEAVSMSNDMELAQDAARMLNMLPLTHQLEHWRRFITKKVEVTPL